MKRYIDEQALVVRLLMNDYMSPVEFYRRGERKEKL